MPKIPLEDLKKDMQIKAFLLDKSLTFKTTWGLFCPEEIDVGTKLLLKAISEDEKIIQILTDGNKNSCAVSNASEDETVNVLDIGCGYGPIGIAIAKAFPTTSVDLIDKDFVAVDYSKKNALENGTENVSAYLSNGFSHVPTDKKYGLIVSNLPAKVSKEFFWILFGEAFDHLETDGYFVVVVIKQLEIMARKNFNTLFGNSEVILRDKTYSVVVTRKE
ncbi:MAG: methyltransferase [Candidatus Pacebacteria bacterium]|nr:methyltransferase [Candidatus Paceibacterota bacterium]MBP9818497.1 methyltransferase [Candidatus Paceibacterota bacterium]